MSYHPCLEKCGIENPADVLKDTTCQSCTSERQGHGKTFEYEVVRMIGSDIGIDDSAIDDFVSRWSGGTGQTDVHDFEFSKLGVKGIEKYGESDGVSIKLMGLGCEICMGLTTRIFNNFEEPWSIILGNYEKISFDHEGKNITCFCINKVRILNLFPTDRHLFFGECSLKDIEGLSQIKEFPKKGSKEEQRAFKDDFAKLKDLVVGKIDAGGGNIGLRAKMNSTNARLQCAIGAKKFDSLYEMLPVAQAVEITREEYPDLFKPIFDEKDTKSPKSPKKTKRRRRKNKRKKRKTRKTRKKKKN